MESFIDELIFYQLDTYILRRFRIDTDYKDSKVNLTLSNKRNLMSVAESVCSRNDERPKLIQNCRNIQLLQFSLYI